MDIKDLNKGIKSDDDSFYFRAKNELIIQQVSKINNKNLKILIVGNGPSQNLKNLKKYGHVYATDINQKALDLIPSNIFFKKMKLDISSEAKFKKNYFDVIIACDVLEHITNDKKAVFNICNILKKNGVVFCTVPAFQFLFSAHDSALGHKRRYSKNTLKKLFDDFKIKKLSYWNFLMFVPIAIKRALSKNSASKIDDLSKVPPIINKILYFFLKIENFLINFVDFPFGLSLFLIAKK
ncbi:MAG: methyltransferase domain-containing protein [Candidatus Nanoarchaeia archaeon]|nr:methyltransferase domain-containing protein [Candidatus Nanoarchaeia archaeon]MDD5053850.1 methyltransferase domain-containing protein [Candidatus Nanoarchaeia archaeon]MDD5499595.1 methyltransferase domain-containing protein [Candidatus Nanoarchaeia archaeon]